MSLMLRFVTLAGGWCAELFRVQGAQRMPNVFAFAVVALLAAQVVVLLRVRAIPSAIDTLLATRAKSIMTTTAKQIADLADEIKLSAGAASQREQALKTQNIALQDHVTSLTAQVTALQDLNTGLQQEIAADNATLDQAAAAMTDANSVLQASATATSTPVPTT